MTCLCKLSLMLVVNTSMWEVLWFLYSCVGRLLQLLMYVLDHVRRFWLSHSCPSRKWAVSSATQIHSPLVDECKTAFGEVKKCAACCRSIVSEIVMSASMAKPPNYVHNVETTPSLVCADLQGLTGKGMSKWKLVVNNAVFWHVFCQYQYHT